MTIVDLANVPMAEGDRINANGIREYAPMFLVFYSHFTKSFSAATACARMFRRVV